MPLTAPLKTVEPSTTVRLRVPSTTEPVPTRPATVAPLSVAEISNVP
ncbi:hypothetical protein [Paraburkholderia tropica]|nr:hypothetical protein [Paraburkholderia tropica]